MNKEKNIIYWTARGTVTGIDWKDITEKQLKSWGAKYHELKMGKPAYDLFIDDKNINSERFLMTSQIKFVPKGWGYEKWIVNNEEYCGKLLFLAKGKQCSWHFHKLKDEVFYVQSGRIKVLYSDQDDIEQAQTVILEPGDNFHVYRGLATFRMIALF